jgi:hypothetical protein
MMESGSLSKGLLSDREETRERNISRIDVDLAGGGHVSRFYGAVGDLYDLLPQRRDPALGLSNRGFVMALCVRLADEATAQAVRQELLGISEIDVVPIDTGWEIRLDSSAPLNLVLNAVRNALRGRPNDVATFLLDGRTYVLQGEAAD